MIKKTISIVFKTAKNIGIFIISSILFLTIFSILGITKQPTMQEEFNVSTLRLEELQAEDNAYTIDIEKSNKQKEIDTLQTTLDENKNKIETLKTNIESIKSKL